MHLCFYFPSLKNKQNNAQFRGMYTGFIEGIEKQNVKVTLTTDLNKIDGDIMILIVGGGLEPIAAKAMHVFKGPVILYVHHAYICFYKSFLKRWHSRILFAYSTDFSDLSFKKYASVNIDYFHIPFASNTEQFFPIQAGKMYDIVFLGNADSGQGRYKYINALMNYAKEKKVEILLAGSGWDKYGYPFQLIAYGKLLNIVYNLGKVCINIHNDRQFLGMEYEMDANNRLFDLSMAGCFQVSNGKDMVKKYYTEDEIVCADDPNEWIKLIDYYLQHDDERTRIAENARRRTLLSHTWDTRGEEFIKIINQKLPTYYNKRQPKNFAIHLLRYFDQYIIPPYRFKEIKIIRYILKKIHLYKAV